MQHDRTEQVIPNPQQHEQSHATAEIAGRFERDIAVHQEVVRSRQHDGHAVPMADGTESTCSKVNDPNSTMVCVADTNRYLPSVFGFFDDS